AKTAKKDEASQKKAEDEAARKAALEASARRIRAPLADLSNRAALQDAAQAVAVAERLSGADKYSIWASKLALASLLATMADEAWKETQAALVADIDTAIEQTVRTEV